MTWIVLIDRSEKPREQTSFISIVVINSSFKTDIYSQIKDWITHTKKLGRKKAQYLNTFEDKYSKVLHLIEVSRVFSYRKGRNVPDIVFEIINKYLHDYTVIIVDDKLLKTFRRKYPKQRVIPEGKLTDKQLKKIMLIADNICNYFRVKGTLDKIWK